MTLAPWKKSYDQPRQNIKKQRHYFADKGSSSQSYGFPSSHVWMWELDCEGSWVPKNWCFWTVVLETLESPLDCKEIQPVHPKGNHSWIFIERTDAEAETPILWLLEVKNWLVGKSPWCWERLKAGGEGDDRIWDDWVASPTQWLWVWVNSGSWWWTGRPGVMQSMGSKGLGHDWATELNGGFFHGSEVEESACNAGDLGLILGQEDPGEGNGNPLQCSCLENSIDRGTWPATVHGISKCWTHLKD